MPVKTSSQNSLLHYIRLFIRLLICYILLRRYSYATVHTVPFVQRTRDKKFDMRTRAYPGFFAIFNNKRYILDTARNALIAYGHSDHSDKAEIVSRKPQTPLEVICDPTEPCSLFSIDSWIDVNDLRKDTFLTTTWTPHSF